MKLCTFLQLLFPFGDEAASLATKSLAYKMQGISSSALSKYSYLLSIEHPVRLEFITYDRGIFPLYQAK